MKPTAPTSDSAAQLKWWSQQAIVYFIAAGNPASAIKIGVTQWSGASSRISACQTGNHEPLEMVGVIPFREGKLPLKDAEDEERRLHLQFQFLRRFPEGVRGQEWFTVAPALLEFIRIHTRPPEEFGFARRVSQMIGSEKKILPNQSPLQMALVVMPRAGHEACQPSATAGL